MRWIAMGKWACAAVAVGVISIGVGAPASGQSLAGVFGPGVREGDRSVQVRTAYSPDASGDRSAHRIHYQHAVSDAHRWRLVVAASERPGQALQVSELRGEWQWQYRETRDNYAAAVRFDVLLNAQDSAPNRIGLNWTHQVELGSGWRLNAVAMAGQQIGDESRGGATLEGRAHLSYAVSDRVRAGVESFNSLGNVRDLGDFDDQRHTVGPVAVIRLNEMWSSQVGVLFGASDSARDADFRLWLGRRF